MKPARLIAVLTLLATGPAWGEVALQKTAVQSVAYAGGSVAYDLTVMRTDTLTETGLVIHDPLPAGHVLQTVQSGGTTIDCTSVAGGMLGTATVTCSVGGELQIAYPDSLTNTPAVRVTYRLPAGTTTSQNSASATCNSGSSCPKQATASTPVSPAPLTIGKSGVTTVAPGGTIAYALTITNPGTADTSGWVASDPLPAGLTFASVQIGGQTFTPAQLASAAAPPTSTMLTLTGSTLSLAGPPLTAGSSFAATVNVTVDGNATNGTRYSNIASLTPLAGSAQKSPAVTTTVVKATGFVSLTQTVTPAHAKQGDSAVFALTLTPSGTVVGPLSVTDPFDPALKITRVTVGGAVASCGANATMAGLFMLSCGTDGHTLSLALPDGTTLAAPVTVAVTTTIGTTTKSALVNIATALFGGQPQSATATLTIDATPAVSASLKIVAGKVMAQANDSVPFVLAVTVPPGAQPLVGAAARIVPSSALRVGALDINGSPAKPTVLGAALVVPLPTILAGQSLELHLATRAKANAVGRAQVSGEIDLGVQKLATAQGAVQIIADADFDLATILGTVYRDDNGDGLRQAGEPGIAGATIIMDDGLHVVSDRDGRYHLAAIVPGERAIKIALNTLPPGARITTDETRILAVSAGMVHTLDFGVAVPALAAPAPAPAVTSSLPSRIRPLDADHLSFRLVGHVAGKAHGARVEINGQAAEMSSDGSYSADVTLSRGRTRAALVISYADGRVVVATRDIYWTSHGAAQSIIPQPEANRLVLGFPARTLTDPQFLLEGQATSPLRQLVVAGQSLTPDSAGHLAVRLRVPEAGAGLAVRADFSDGTTVRFTHVLEANGDYFFLVGLVEGKFGYVQRDASFASGTSGYFAEGRVKLYAEGRIQGRWLIEGGVDIDSTQISSWRDLFRGDPSQVFRNLDPDRYYTVYGDESSTTPSSGGPPHRTRLYVSVKLDRSELLFGNFETGLTGVEFGRYSRAVTGGKLSFVRAATTPGAPPSTQVIVFGAWLQTARAHDELRGTGGSLYYLSHRGIVEGSEQVRVELRDRISNRPDTNATQHAQVDYDVDYLAGRVMLRDPLSSVTATDALVRSNTLDGDQAYLIVDYEYVVTGDVDDGVAGLRAAQQLGRVRLGGTVVNEFRSLGSYTLVGGDAKIDLGKVGSIVGEYAHSFGDLSAFSRSDDGGLHYTDQLASQATTTRREGNAWKAEADLHGDVGHLHLAFAPYARGMDQGYTDTAHATDSGYVQWGANAEMRYGLIALRAHYDERHYEQDSYDATGAPLLSASGQPITAHDVHRDIGLEAAASWGRWKLRLGGRWEEDDGAAVAIAGERATVAARLEAQVTPKLTLYGGGQYAPYAHGTGLTGENDSLGLLGMTAQLPWQLKLTAEGSYGAQGVGGLLGLRADRGKGRVLYGTVTVSADHDDRVGSQLAAGGRDRVLDANGHTRMAVYAEDQFRDGTEILGGDAGQVGRAHLLVTGIDLPLAQRFLFGASFERGQVQASGTPLSPTATQPLDRVAGTAQVSYATDKFRAEARGELRQDSVTESAPTTTDPTATDHYQELSWLTSVLVTWKPNSELMIRGKALFSHAGLATPGPGGSTSSTTGALALGRSNEASLGISWRPSWTDRVALLFRYAYLDEGLSQAQAANGPKDPLTGQPLEFRERSHVLALGGEGRLFWRISLGEKVAAKYRGEPDLGTASWLVMWVNRAALHVTKAWDAVVEYRLLSTYSPAVPATRQNGVSLEVNRILYGHLRLGVGWSFANFSDDELQLGNGNGKGIYVRAEGYY